MSAPIRVPARRRGALPARRGPAVQPRAPRPDLVPLFLLTAPVIGVGCAALSSLLGLWALLLAAVALVAAGGVAVWSLGDERG